MKAASIYASINLNSIQHQLIAKRFLEAKKAYNDTHAWSYRTTSAGSTCGYKNMALPAISLWYACSYRKIGSTCHNFYNDLVTNKYSLTYTYIDTQHITKIGGKMVESCAFLYLTCCCICSADEFTTQVSTLSTNSGSILLSNTQLFGIRTSTRVGWVFNRYWRRRKWYSFKWTKRYNIEFWNWEVRLCRWCYCLIKAKIHFSQRIGHSPSRPP